VAAPYFLYEKAARDDKAARELLVRVLWPDGPVCPKCGVVNHAYVTRKPGVFRCAEKGCRKDFTVTTNTVMERSHIALHKWLQGFHLMTSSKTEVNPHQLRRTLGISYEAARFMAHRIREAMRAGGLRPPRGGRERLRRGDASRSRGAVAPRARGDAGRPAVSAHDRLLRAGPQRREVPCTRRGQGQRLQGDDR
jgi:transposase-like protein